jgi:hypothetical protein
MIDDHSVVIIRCLGDRPGVRWLDGRTADRTVGLAPVVGVEPFSGTKWRVLRLEGLNNVYSFICLGEFQNPHGLFLCVETAGQSHPIFLKDTTEPGLDFQERAWQLREIQDEGHYLSCYINSYAGVGNLDGRTLDGSVGITNANPSGTHWAIVQIGL